MKVLICDKLPEQCSEIIRNAGLEPVVKTDMTPEQLKANIGQYDGVIVRSSTRITADALSAAGRLRVVCRAGVGVDNVDVVAASKKGVVVMNTPGGNTVSTAEHTVAMLLALTRSIRQAANSVKEGKWDRKKFTGTQLAGKTLGVVGLGRVGFEVARRAAAFEMRVLAYDPYITTEKAAQCQASLVKRLDDLYRQSDYITLHTPLTDDTRGLVGKRAFGLMKKGVRIIN
ncbi:MAG: phosphoglycerate dehydrogenase, partial [Planctomycetes bacterium]|nr:phosphoglycerate dehydrogenase [Planctomycetota bacterium]